VAGDFFSNFSGPVAIRIVHGRYMRIQLSNIIVGLMPAAPVKARRRVTKPAPRRPKAAAPKTQKPKSKIASLNARLKRISWLESRFMKAKSNAVKPFYFFYIVQEYNALRREKLIDAPAIKASLFSLPRRRAVLKLVGIMKKKLNQAIAKLKGYGENKLRDLPDIGTPEPKSPTTPTKKNELRDLPEDTAPPKRFAPKAIRRTVEPPPARLRDLPED
jgi:hypothetical protein